MITKNNLKISKIEIYCILSEKFAFVITFNFRIHSHIILTLHLILFTYSDQKIYSLLLISSYYK
jgi:hypothetical protein